MKYRADRYPRAARLGQPQLSVHGRDVGIAAVDEHAAYDRIKALADRAGQVLEGLQAAAPRPAHPGLQRRLGRVGGVNYLGRSCRLN